jgi:hypothetical protein
VVHAIEDGKPKKNRKLIKKADHPCRPPGD